MAGALDGVGNGERDRFPWQNTAVVPKRPHAGKREIRGELLYPSDVYVTVGYEDVVALILLLTR